jgi:uncharacterized surface protein with fasciclin (FAS1) repeats
MKRQLPKFIATGILGISLLTSCQKQEVFIPSIAGIAVAEADFQMLEDAAIKGGLAVVLSNKNQAPGSDGDFTVFAPNNAAFARLGLTRAAELDALQTPFLTNTLRYHVFNGSLPSTQFAAGLTTESALGPTRRLIYRPDGSVYVNGSRIIATDVRASNGLVHTIDKVMLATGGNVVQSAVALQSAQVFTRPELTFLVAAVLRCNLQGALSAPGPYTVFAPTDQAFKDAGIPSLAALNAMDVPTLTSILLNHVLVNNASAQLGSKFTPELPENSSVTALGGGRLQLGSFANGLLTVKSNGAAQPANLVIPDVQATNGVVHVIDRVLVP